MKTGIELIAEERQEQIEKHERDIQHDVEYNDMGELIIATRALLQISDSDTHVYVGNFPGMWNREICAKMALKPYKERLIIAGALIAAEIDRLQYEHPDQHMYSDDDV